MGGEASGDDRALGFVGCVGAKALVFSVNERLVSSLGLDLGDGVEI